MAPRRRRQRQPRRRRADRRDHDRAPRRPVPVHDLAVHRDARRATTLTPARSRSASSSGPRRRVRHRHPVPQGRPTRHAHRPPCGRARAHSSARYVHRRDGHRAGSRPPSRRPSRSRPHDLRRLVLRARRPLLVNSQLLRDPGDHQRAADGAACRRRAVERRVPLRRDPGGFPTSTFQARTTGSTSSSPSRRHHGADGDGADAGGGGDRRGRSAR